MDTSVWIDHLRRPDPSLSLLIDAGQVLCHPHVIGELAIGTLRHRQQFLADMARMPVIAVADDAEVLQLIEMQKLFGRGLGYVDVHLLASVRLTAGATLWSRDRRLAQAARDSNVAHAPEYLN